MEKFYVVDVLKPDNVVKPGTYFAVNYPYDRKMILLCHTDEPYEPMRTEYTYNLKFLGWLTRDELKEQLRSLGYSEDSDLMQSLKPSIRRFR